MKTVKFTFKGKRRQRTFNAKALAYAESQCEKHGVTLEQWCQICAKVNHAIEQGYRECLVMNSRGTAMVTRQTRERIQFEGLPSDNN